MATVNLGRIKPVFRGAYAGGTAYVVDDIVTHGDETFICIQAGTGNATSNASYWTKLAAKGADGTNVATTLTTQGDILYRDGSGLQRLPKGTAGQVLQMNSGATAPEYGTVSSDWVKISHVDSTTAVQTHNFQSVFNDSIYSAYQIMASCEIADNDDFRARLMSGSTVLSGSNDYFRMAYQSYRRLDGSGNTLTFDNDGDATNTMNIVPWGFSNEAGATHNVKMDIHGLLQSTDRDKQILYAGSGRDNSNPDYHHINQGVQIYSNQAQSVDGISFYTNNNNFQRFTGTVWGMKK